MDDRLEELGRRITELREERAETQYEFAERIGIAPSSLSLIENGRVRPHARTLRKIAQGFGVDPQDLWSTAGKVLAPVLSGHA